MKVKTTRFADDGLVALAVGEIGEAYAPKCASDGCRKRSVEQATRTFVYVRPSLLVIQDRVVLESPDYDVTWAAHLTQNPVLAGDLASAVIGASRVDLRTIEPREATHAALREPTPSGEGSHRLNQPWGPMWRVEVRSPRGARDRNFLHFITAAAAAEAPPASQSLSGDGLRGAVGRVDGRSVAVLFAEALGEGRVTLGREVELLVIAGLVPGRRYGVSIDGSSCALRLGAKGAADVVATGGGFLRVNVDQCRLK
jgi:hypothetical protein